MSLIWFSRPTKAILHGNQKGPCVQLQPFAIDLPLQFRSVAIFINIVRFLSCTILLNFINLSAEIALYLSFGGYTEVANI